MQFDAVTWQTVYETVAPLWFVGAAYIAAFLSLIVYDNVYLYYASWKTKNDPKGSVEKEARS